MISFVKQLPMRLGMLAAFLSILLIVGTAIVLLGAVLVPLAAVIFIVLSLVG